MRLYLLENFANSEYENWEDSDEVLALVKSDCSSFINEFLKKNIPVYRGLDNLRDYSVYLVPTETRRETHGGTFSQRDIADSFDRFLDREGMGSRYAHSVSTTTSSPSEYSGVIVDSWYYFLPKGPYKYHYVAGVEHDINVTRDSHPLTELRKVNNALQLITRLLSEYGNRIEETQQELQRDDSELALIIDPEDFDALLRNFNEMIGIMKNIFDEGKESRLEVLQRYAVMPTLERLAKVYSMYQSRKWAWGLNVFKRCYDALDDLGSISDIVKRVKEIIVGNEIKDSIESNEVVFTCKEYYVIPYNEDGKKFINRLMQ